MSEADDSRGEFVKAGYLVKSPPISRAYVSQWHRRWFLLMDSRLVYPMADRYLRLEYYQSEADAKRLADPKGLINLSSCLSIISSSVPIKNFKFVFDVSTTDRVYHLAADSEEERLDWVSTLKELLFPSVSSQKNVVLPRSPPIPAPRKSLPTRSQESARVPRPVSLATGISSENKGRGSSAVQRRPLPAVPGGSVSTNVASSPVEVRKRPLPATPGQGIHINPVGIQTSPLVQKKRIAQPPPKPSPYRKNKSEPSPPTYRKNKSDLSPPPSMRQLPPPSHFARSASLSPPPSLLLAEDYQEFITQSQPESCDYEFAESQPESSDYEFAQPDSCVYEFAQPESCNSEFCLELNAVEDNYSLATSVPKMEKNPSRTKSPGTRAPPRSDDEYSVLEPTVVSGYDSTDTDYSHLEGVVSDSPPPPIRYSSLATHHGSDTSKPQHRPRSNQRPHSSIPDYVNYPSSSNDDYSCLQH